MAKRLCPTLKSNEVKSAQDLTPRAFRKLVARRGQYYTAVVETPKTEKERKVIEEEIKFSAELVDGESNFLPAAFLRDGARKARAVCRISIESSPGRISHGTGFLIAPTILMTNNHVIKDANQANKSMAEFGFEEGVEDVVTVKLNPDQLFITNKTLDFTIVACFAEGIESIEHIPLLRNPATITRHEHVNIIQHPDARPKEVSLQDNTVLRVRDLVIRYTTDTEPGSSGSPVFNNDWELVALHHAGADLGDGRAENEGIRISAIVNFLLVQPESSAPPLRDAITGVLDHIEGVSPYLGFFDTAGLGDFTNEVEVPNFSGTPEFADVGFWNIQHFNDSVSDSRVRDVTDVVNGLSLDVLALTEVQNGSMQRLVDELQLLGNFVDYELVNVRGAQDLAILYDKETAEVEIINTEMVQEFSTQLRAKTDDGKSAFPRRPLFAHCKIKDREEKVNEFILISVHLKAFGDPQSRARRRLAAEKLVQMIEIIREKRGLPVVLGGDYNDRLNTNTFAPLQDSPDLVALTADDASSDAISYIGAQHRSLIDHIIVSNDTLLGSISSDDAAIVRLDKSITDFVEDVSDHVPVVFRMIFRDVALDLIDRGGNSLSVDIPDGTTQLEVSFS